VEVEPDPKSDSLGVSHTPLAWLLPIMDFPQPHYISTDQNTESYNNAWESLVRKLKIHEKVPHANIDSSSNPMDSLQGHMLPEVWTMPTWASAEALALDPHMVVLPALIHVHNTLNLSLNM
jgi:hypothetical protein